MLLSIVEMNWGPSKPRSFKKLFIIVVITWNPRDYYPREKNGRFFDPELNLSLSLTHTNTGTRIHRVTLNLHNFGRPFVN